ncbi:hypothetical protein [Polluticaenibacter yanchengensis]|uniref:Uncharacterized protein n=1 Tax=Polluticaenibacter yanchengensis TaxID=3014562 RepID=A0ABT4UGP1_9BACT|nr:hypothetical protein [Chitinophagaceae bacterium LY-5]
MNPGLVSEVEAHECVHAKQYSDAVRWLAVTCGNLNSYPVTLNKLYINT